MAEEVKTKVEKEVKKLDDVKETPENKAAIAKDEGKTEVKESKPAVKKEVKAKEKKETVELEREYVVPLKRGVLNVPHYRRAKKAVRVLKEFMVKHMQVRDRDLRKVKVDINLNNEIWFRGIKKPMNKIKVKAKKIDGIVYVELAEIPEVVGYKIAREEKAKAAVNVKAPKAKEKTAEEDADKDGVADKVEEKEDVKAGAEKAAKTSKATAKNVQHSTKGSHAKKSMPVRKVLK
jgi:ribosomal protein L31E